MSSQVYAEHAIRFAVYANALRALRPAVEEFVQGLDAPPHITRDLVNAMEDLEAHLEVCSDSAWRAHEDHCGLRPVTDRNPPPTFDETVDEDRRGGGR